MQLVLGVRWMNVLADGNQQRGGVGGLGCLYRRVRRPGALSLGISASDPRVLLVGAPALVG
jgi:hypothetical protein